MSFIQNYYTLSKKYNKNPNIFYIEGDKHFWFYDWSYENKLIKIISVFQTLCKYFMVSFICIDQSRNGFPMTCTLIIIFKIKTGDEDFRGRDRYITLALERIVESRLNFNFLGVINYGISEIYVANIVLQKHFSPDPCLIDKGTTVSGHNISHKQQKMFKISPIVWINFILPPGFKNLQTMITEKLLILRL